MKLKQVKNWRYSARLWEDGNFEKICEPQLIFNQKIKYSLGNRHLSVNLKSLKINHTLLTDMTKQK